MTKLSRSSTRTARRGALLFTIDSNVAPTARAPRDRTLTNAMSPPARENTSVNDGLAQTLGVGVVFYVLTLMSTQLGPGVAGAAPFWPPAGFLLGWLLLSSRQDWLRIVAVASVARLAVAVRASPDIAIAAGYTVASVGVAVLTAALLRRLKPRVHRLDSVDALFALIVVPIVISGPLTAAVRAAVLLLGGRPPMSAIAWAEWWFGDALGVIIMAPLVLTARRMLSQLRHAPLALRLEGAAIAVLAAGGATLVFVTPAAHAEPLRPLLAVIVMPFVWGALRLGVVGVAWTLAPFAAVAAWSTVHGRGVFAALPGDASMHVLVLQAYLAITFLGVMIVAATVDGQRRSLGRLRSSEEKFRRLVNAAPVPMMITDDGDESLYVNPALAALVGGSPSEAGSVDAWWERLVPDVRYRVALREEAQRRTRDGAATALPPIPATIVVADGSVRHVELQAVCAGEQGITTLVDLTERVRAAEAMRASEAEFRAVFERAALPMSLIGVDGHPFKVNPPFCALLGYTAEELCAMHVTAFTHVDDRGESELVLNDLLTGKRDSGSLEKRYRHKDGRFVRVRLTVSVVRDRVGVPPYCISVIEDVTERDQLELQLRQVQKLEALGTLAGGVAHDFNNILAALLGNLELARGELPESHPAYEFLDEVKHAGARASDLVRQIMTFSRRQEQERGVIPVTPVVREALALLRAVVPASVRIEEQLSSDLPMVIGDGTQLHQVVMNLATNAVHAMNEHGGVLRMVVERVIADAELCRRIPELREGAHVRLTVSDTGHGMAPETLDRVFEPFFTTKVAGEGTGLGLSVVHGIVRSHDGAISVTSEPGRGTSFAVYLPVSAELPHAALMPSAAAPRGDGARVLYVDDEPVLARLAERSLTRLGYRPTVLTRPREALIALRGNLSAFDVLVTDLTMPEMSGLQLAAEALRLRPDLPVVLATGYTGMLTPELARERGLRGVLLKPFTPEHMARALADAMREKPAA